MSFLFTLVLKFSIEEELVSSVSIYIGAAPFNCVGATAVSKEVDATLKEEASVLPNNIFLTLIKLLPFIVTVPPGKITLGVKSDITGLKWEKSCLKENSDLMYPWASTEDLFEDIIPAKDKVSNGWDPVCKDA